MLIQIYSMVSLDHMGLFKFRVIEISKSLDITTDGSYHSYEISFESSGLCVIWTSNEIHMKIMATSIFHTNYIWISYEVHMNFTWNTYVAETFDSYELHKNFIRTSYEFRRKYTRIIR